MKILLLIGKVLGFGLLGILGLLLLILFLVLFLPICYDIEGVYEEQKALKVRVYDGFHIFCFSFSKEGEDSNTRLRILWKHLMQEEEEEEPEVEVAEGEVSEDYFEAEEPPAVTTVEEKEVKEPESQTEPEPEKKTQKKQKKKRSDKEGSKDDIIGKMRLLLEDEEAKAGIAFLLREVGRFLRRLAPKRYRFQGEFYTGDPATTGQITGLLATIPWLQPRKGNYLLPDFSREEFYLYGRMGIAGSIQLVCVVGMALRIFFNRNVRKLYAYFKEND